MRRFSAVLLLAFLCNAEALKFLSYSTAMGRSPLTFQGKLSDALIDAGHEVVILQPMIDTRIGTHGSDKARVVEIPQFPGGEQLEKQMEGDGGFMKDVWKGETVFDMLSLIFTMQEPLMKQCNLTLHHPGLIEKLRNEKFDAAYLEMRDYCGIAVLKSLGIDKFAITMSIGGLDGSFFITGVPDFPAYVPSLSSPFSDKMNLFERAGNFILSRLFLIFFGILNSHTEKLVAELHPEWDTLTNMFGDASLLFLNNEPLIEFQRPISHKIIDIGGITATNSHKPLNETWSNILSLRSKTVLLSFGTMAKSSLMPEQYKKSVLQAFKKFPDVTFIWKYEAPEHRITEGTDNVIESTWVPQNDVLNDPRLSLFITHCGAGSTMEATRAGKPLIVFPIMGDQQRNAQVVRRIGTGIVLDKTDLESSKLLEESIKEVLQNDKYRRSAQYHSDMLRNRPFNMKDIFVKNMEFLAKYGPLRMLDHYSRNLNFIQYYLIDVFAFLTAIVLVVITVVVVIIRCSLKCICSVVRRGKAKTE